MHGCYPPRANCEASSNVIVNGRGWHRQGDGWEVHCWIPPNCHGGSLASGSSTVYVNNKQAGRVTDPVSCGSSVATGSSNTYCGG